MSIGDHRLSATEIKSQRRGRRAALKQNPIARVVTHAERYERRKLIADDVKKNGLTVAQVSKKYKISPTWVRSICSAAGVTLQVDAPKYPLKSVALKILFGMLDGVPIAKLSSKYKVTRQGIHQLRQNAEAVGFIFPPYATQQRVVKGKVVYDPDMRP